MQQVEVSSLDALRRWLAAHHQQTASIWLVTYKKSVPEKYLSKDDVIDEALCWGWIDSLPRKLDDERTMLRLSPRRASSAWSRVNKDKVERLAREGRLQPAGLAKIEAAKANGMWSFLDDVDALIKPPDLVAALAKYAGAATNFDAFPKSSQRGILEWIKQAKTSGTRERRIEQTAELASRNIMANHPASVRQR